MEMQTGRLSWYVHGEWIRNDTQGALRRDNPQREALPF